MGSSGAPMELIFTQNAMEMSILRESWFYIEIGYFWCVPCKWESALFYRLRRALLATRRCWLSVSVASFFCCAIIKDGMTCMAWNQPAKSRNTIIKVHWEFFSKSVWRLLQSSLCTPYPPKIFYYSLAMSVGVKKGLDQPSGCCGLTIIVKAS